jgi:hypothetical protein
VGVATHTELELLVSRIARAAEAVEIALGACPNTSGDSAVLIEGRELRRQLDSLRARVSAALDGYDDPRGLRSELGTLLFFANTLQADADAWRAGLDRAIHEHERQSAAARRAQERRAAERRELARRRDHLASAIRDTAERMAQPEAGECRNTLPVFTLGAGFTVCSVSVSCPRRRFRFPKHWLVTLNDARDQILVRRT